MPGRPGDSAGDAIPAALAAGDVMTRPAVAAGPAATATELLARMIEAGHRAVVVVDRGFPIGLLTGSDLVRRGAMGGSDAAAWATEGGEALDAALRARLAACDRPARALMTPDVVTVEEAVPLRAAAEVLARRRLRRLPVVTSGGRLAGVLSRVDVLRAAAGGGWEARDGPAIHGLDARAPVTAFMRTGFPAVAPGAGFEETLRAVATTGVDRALVLDEGGRVLGVVTDAPLLERIAPPLRRGLFSASLAGLPFGHRDREEAERRAVARTAAEMMVPVPTAAPELPLGEAIARLLPGAHKLLAVVDPGGRLLGTLDRADVLRGLLG